VPWVRYPRSLDSEANGSTGQNSITEHHKLILEGVAAWNDWRSSAPGLSPDLAGANLRGLSAQGANLTGAQLSSADLTGANLVGAQLNDASLRGATIIQPDSMD
jgi:uncharacterized protein YjbI with pentapeptide repeats